MSGWGRETARRKSPSDWKTFLIFGEGRGGTSNLWSSSASCDGNFRNVYSSTYTNYCGYYALDITNTYSPAYKWRIGPSAAQAPYLGDSWSKMMVHRVKINGNEKWVGFIGGGNNLSSCSGGGCDIRGKGFFVVEPVRRRRPVELHEGGQQQHELCRAGNGIHCRLG